LQTGDGKTKDSEQKSSKHSLNFIYSNLFVNAIFIYYCRPQISELRHIFEELLSDSGMRFYPTFWCRDITMHSVFSEFTSRQTPHQLYYNLFLAKMTVGSTFSEKHPSPDDIERITTLLHTHPHSFRRLQRDACAYKHVLPISRQQFRRFATQTPPASKHSRVIRM